MLCIKTCFSNIHMGKGHSNRGFNIIFPPPTISPNHQFRSEIRFNPFFMFSQMPTPGAIENNLVNIKFTNAILIRW